jgi:hypothetical protein
MRQGKASLGDRLRGAFTPVEIGSGQAEGPASNVKAGVRSRDGKYASHVAVRRDEHPRRDRSDDLIDHLEELWRNLC